MKTLLGSENRRDIPTLQDLLDSVPDNQKVACLPTSEALVLYAGDKELGRIPLDGLADVSLIDDSSVQKHYTLSRILTIGPLVLLFPKKTFHEAYRICIEWQDPEGDYNFTYILIPTRIMAEHMLKSVQRVLTEALFLERGEYDIQNIGGGKKARGGGYLDEPSGTKKCA